MDLDYLDIPQNFIVIHYSDDRLIKSDEQEVVTTYLHS